MPRTDPPAAPDPYTTHAYAILFQNVPGDDLPRHDSGYPGDPDELAVLLHRRMGEDGLYVVAVEHSVSGFAAGISDVDPVAAGMVAYRATRDLEVELSPAGLAVAQLRLSPVVDDIVSRDSASAAIEVVLELMTQPVMTAASGVEFSSFTAQRELTTPTWQPSNTDHSYLGIGVIVAVATAAVANVVFARVAARRAELNWATDITPVRERLRAALATIDQWDPLTSGPDGGPVPTVAWTAADAARALRDATDPADIMGAAILAEHAVRTARQLDPAPAPKPCFLNPLHGRHKTTAELPGDGTTAHVPVCQRCAGALAAGRRPDTFRVRNRWRVVAYYRRLDVWSVSGYGALRDDVAELVLAGARAGTSLPGRLAHEAR
jgi:hypothetical protein